MAEVESPTLREPLRSRFQFVRWLGKAGLLVLLCVWWCCFKETGEGCKTSGDAITQACKHAECKPCASLNTPPQQGAGGNVNLYQTIGSGAHASSGLVAIKASGQASLGVKGRPSLALVAYAAACSRSS